MTNAVDGSRDIGLPVQKLLQLWQKAAEDMIETDMNQGAWYAPFQSQINVSWP